MRVLFQCVVIATVFVHVEGLDDLVLVRELDGFVLQVLGLRATAVDHGTGVKVELYKLSYRKIAQRFHTRALSRTAPQVIQDAPPHPHQHLHAGAADADEQRGSQIDGGLALRGWGGVDGTAVIYHEGFLSVAF